MRLCASQISVATMVLAQIVIGGYTIDFVLHFAIVAGSERYKFCFASVK
jgi:hypothetical protein